MSHIIAAQKRDSDAEPILKPTIVEEVSLDDEEEEALFDDFEDGKHPYTLFSFNGFDVLRYQTGLYMYGISYECLY